MIGIADLALFAGVFAASAATPGPEVVAVTARSLDSGFRGVSGLAAGIIVGKLTLLGMAMAGLAAATAAYEPILRALTWAGAVYLCYLAAKKWRTAGAPALSVPTRDTPRRAHSVGLGIVLTMSNPVAVGFYVALLPSVLDLTQVHLDDYLLLGLTLTTVMAVIIGLYGLAGLRLRRFFDRGGQRIVDRTTAGVFLLCAVFIVLR
ncbi:MULTISPECIES: LysE family translocator [unclassified Rhodococcus (in: high G+C Gram-positive bacteria)]|uniref:LysE family translocator n=1 Tax=unclassified Rhodococcus (in: high G+C Gram-positive bacteria) TaxID=192944 RepID=UPI001595123C|nr:MULTISPECIES: LysE family translocator [unclassified Rhodococcus (in: high G+C Gram-positive bacteria)]